MRVYAGFVLTKCELFSGSLIISAIAWVSIECVLILMIGTIQYHPSNQAWPAVNPVMIYDYLFVFELVRTPVFTGPAMSKTDI